VCGRARGYQKGVTLGFYSYNIAGQTTIDGFYADGLFLTHGNPRQHIWTYVATSYDNVTYTFNCPCAVGGGLDPPPLWKLIITVNQEASIVIAIQPIALMIHCGMDLIATVVLTVALTLPYHGFIES